MAWRSARTGAPWPPPATTTRPAVGRHRPGPPARIGHPDRPHRRCGRGGVQPGRAHPGHRQRRQHRRLWDVTDPAHPPASATLTGHTDAVYAVAFSPDGRTLATASVDQHRWAVGRHATAPIPTHRHPDRPHRQRCARWRSAPTGSTLATASDDDTVGLWDSPPATPIGPPSPATHDGCVRVAFSPDGRTLATASDDQTVRLWDVTDRLTCTHRHPDRPHRPACARWRSARTGTPRHRQRRQHGDAVGCHRPSQPARSPPSPATPARVLGGVQPGRAHPGHRQRRQHGDGCGMSLTEPPRTHRHPHRPHQR